MSADTGAPSPTDRAFYKAFRTDILRFADLDTVGHVNNNAIGVFLENGRVTLFAEAGEDISANASYGKTFSWVVRRLEIDFIHEIRFPGTVEIGTTVTRFGNSSCDVHQGIFVDGRCVVTSKTIAVCFDLANRTSTPIPDSVRAALREKAGAPGA